MIYASVVLGAGGLISLMVVKLGYQNHLESKSVLLWNTVIAVCGIVMLATCFGIHARRVHVVTVRGLRW